MSTKYHSNNVANAFWYIQVLVISFLSKNQPNKPAMKFSVCSPLRKLKKKYAFMKELSSELKVANWMNFFVIITQM